MADEFFLQDSWMDVIFEDGVDSKPACLCWDLY